MRRDVPQAWAEVMAPRGLHSIRDLATAADVYPSTISRLVFGESTSDDTVRAVADALHLSEAKVWELHGNPRPNPFVLGREADDLSPTQRSAVRAVIAAMLEDKVATVHTLPPPTAKQLREDQAARRSKRSDQ